jgi:hypothetical protein
MNARWLLLFGLGLTIGACRSKESSESAPTSLPPKVAAPALPQTKPLREPMLVEPPELPTEADFEEEATQDITSKNLEEALDTLERELQKP